MRFERSRTVVENLEMVRGRQISIRKRKFLQKRELPKNLQYGKKIGVLDRGLGMCLFQDVYTVQ